MGTTGQAEAGETEARARVEAVNARLAGKGAWELLDVGTLGRREVERHRLGNGLVLLMLVDHSAPVFAYHTWFRVGSRLEKEGKTGLAHLFEHLLFKGTKTHPAGEFDRRMEQVGAQTNAATWLDWTWYHEALPAGQLALAVELESDRMVHLDLGEGPFKSEREVVVNERRYRVDNDPDGLAGERLYRLAFTQHAYGRPTIGWMKDIAGLTLSDCLTFYRTWYAPNNAVLVVVGDVDPAEVLERVGASYGPLAAQKLPEEVSETEPEQRTERTETITFDVAADRLYIGYKAPAPGEADHAALQVLGDVLFDGDSSRLVRQLVFESGVAAQIEGALDALRAPGLFQLHVRMKDGHAAKEGLALLGGAIARVAAEGITERELTKVRNGIAASRQRHLQSVEGRAAELGEAEVESGHWRERQRWYERVAAVTREDVQRVATAWLDVGRRTVITVTPKQAHTTRAGAKTSRQAAR